jgi:hypothetical protein
MPGDSGWRAIEVLVQGSLLTCGFELHDIAWLRLRVANCTDGKLDYGMRRKASGKPPRAHIASHFSYAVLLVEIDEVKGELHEKSMNRLAGDDPHPFSRVEAFATKKPF